MGRDGSEEVDERWRERGVREGGTKGGVRATHEGCGGKGEGGRRMIICLLLTLIAVEV